MGQKRTVKGKIICHCYDFLKTEVIKILWW